MTLKRVCLFLICAFSVVNLFLLGLCIHARNNLLYLSESMITDASAYFESFGVSVDPEVIHKRIPDNAVYTFREDNANMAMTVAEQLKNAYFSGASVSPVETPDGVTYSFGADGGVSASLRVYTSSFRFEFTHEDFLREKSSPLSAKAFESPDTKVTGEVLDIAKAFLKNISLSQKTESLYTLHGVMPFDGGIYLCFLQNAEKCPINEMNVNVFVKGGKVVYAAGNSIFASFSKSYRQALSDGVNAIGGMDFTQVKSVLSQEIIYDHRLGSGGVHYLIPRWKIIYVDTNDSKQTQYVDAMKA